MKVFFLTRSSLPSRKRGQREIILLCLQPPGTRKSLDQLVDECLSRGYALTFRHPHVSDLEEFTATSILYHFRQSQMGLLICSDEQSQ